METSLHTEKVAILSRLIKESSITLEEALLLLKEEDVQESVQESVQPAWNPGFSTSPYILPFSGGTSPLLGTVTVSNGVGFTTSNGVVSTTSFPHSSTHTADLNN